MTIQTKKKISEIPIALGGVSLGVMSISTALVDYGISWVRHVAVIFSVICIGLIVTKAILHPKKVSNEIKNPLLGSIYPTVFMTMMVMSVYLAQFSQNGARVVWLFALISHFILSVVFFKEQFKSFKLINLIPSWFVPTVGIGVASVTSKPIGLPSVSNVVFYYTIALFIVVAPPMVYRVFYMEKLEGPKKATLMIMAAPANICLASYIAIADPPNKLVINILAVLAYISIIGTYALLPNLIKAKMLAALAPLTFPLAIGVISCQRYVKYLGKIQSPMQGVANTFLYVQIAVSVLVIAYVTYRAVSLLIKTFAANENLQFKPSN